MEDQDLDLDAIRQDLEERRDRTRETIAGLAKRPERGTAQGFGKRIGDGTVEAISRLTEIGVGASLEAGLERTERALAKLDEGTYGVCDVCGEPIGEKRLKAMPDVVTCVACASLQPRPRHTRRLAAFALRIASSSAACAASPSTVSCSDSAFARTAARIASGSVPRVADVVERS
jgi:DnaK suppressor protein